MGREDDVPAGVARHHLGQHLLVALVDAIAHADDELLLEVRRRFGGDVAGPVEHVEPRPAAAAAAGQGQRRESERPPIHAERTFSDTMISAPKTTTIIAEIALISGFTPRRARSEEHTSELQSP